MPTEDAERARRDLAPWRRWGSDLSGQRLPEDHGWTVEIDTAGGTAGCAVSASIDLASRSLALLSASQ